MTENENSTKKGRRGDRRMLVHHQLQLVELRSRVLQHISAAMLTIP